MNDHLTGMQKALLYCAFFAPLFWILFAVWCFFHGDLRSGGYALLALLPIPLFFAALKKPKHPLALPAAVLGGFAACMLAAASFTIPFLFTGAGSEASGLIFLLVLIAPPVTGVWGAAIALRWLKDRRLMDDTEKDWQWRSVLEEAADGTDRKVIVMAALAFVAVSVLLSIVSGGKVLDAAFHLGIGVLSLIAGPLCAVWVLRCRKTMDHDPYQSRSDCLNRVLLYMSKGDHQSDLEAEKWIKNFFTARPDCSTDDESSARLCLAGAASYMVTLYMDLGRLRKAAGICKEGLDLTEPLTAEKPCQEVRALRRFFHETLFHYGVRKGKTEEKAAAGASFLNLLPQGEELSRTDPETLCRLYTTASAVMRENNDCKAAFEYLDQAEALLNDQYEASRRSYMEGLILKEKAAVLKQEGDAAGAETSLMKALSLFGSVTDEVPKNRSRVQAGRICYTLAEIRRTEGNFEEALRYYQDALKIFLGRFGEKHHYVADVYLGLADLYAFAGEKEKASRYYQDAAELMKLCSGVDSPDAIRANLVLAGHYKESGSAYKEKECLDDALTGLRESGRSAEPVVKEIKERINELAAETGLEG